MPPCGILAPGFWGGIGEVLTTTLRTQLSAALVAVLPFALSAQAVEQAGVSAAVYGQVELARPGGPPARPVASGESILLQDSLRSGPRSGAQLLLLDETVFTLGPDSELLVDEFVYDPRSGAGRMSARVTQGVFRFVSGRIAKEHPKDVQIQLPSGTLGIRGTLVAGRVDEMTHDSLLVLLGEGVENDTGSPPGAIEVCNAGQCVNVNRAGYGSRIGGPDEPPTAPFLVPLAEIDALTRSVSQPTDIAGKPTEPVSETADVAASAEGGDSRSPTEVSGRAEAEGEALGAEVAAGLGAIAVLDEATDFSAQDAAKVVSTPLGDVTAGGGLPPFVANAQLTRPDQITALASSGFQTAVFSRSNIALTDSGSYDFNLTLDVGARSLALQIDQVNAPTLSLYGAEFERTVVFPKNGSVTPVALTEQTRLVGGDGGCGGGCNAFIQAYLVDGNGRVADHVLQSLSIVPEGSEGAPAGAPVVTRDPYAEIRR